MSVECSECERDLRGGHDEDCSRHHSKVTARLEAELAEYKDANAKLTERIAELEQQIEQEQAIAVGLQQQLDDEREKVTFYRDREVK